MTIAYNGAKMEWTLLSRPTKDYSVVKAHNQLEALRQADDDEQLDIEKEKKELALRRKVEPTEQRIANDADARRRGALKTNFIHDSCEQTYYCICGYQIQELELKVLDRTKGGMLLDNHTLPWPLHAGVTVQDKHTQRIGVVGHVYFHVYSEGNSRAGYLLAHPNVREAAQVEIRWADGVSTFARESDLKQFRGLEQNKPA